MRIPGLTAGMCVAVLIAAGLTPVRAQSEPNLIEPEGSPEISGGALGVAGDQGVATAKAGPTTSYLGAPLNLGRFYVDKSYGGMAFDDNATENGVRFIPPDPMGAAGHSRIVSVVNSMIEARTKSGQFKWRDGLMDFFAPLAPAGRPFDPKIVYDDHEQRFVVVALELVVGSGSQSPSNVSRILLAVSKSDNPKSAGPADWNFAAVNAKQTIFGSFDGWADYPGFEVDEEAVYVTANIFTFSPFGFFGGSRLWIVDKGAGSGGFYDGGPAGVTVHDPYVTAGLATTTMPAGIAAASGAGPGVGTYLVSYSGLTDGVLEYVQIVRVDDPLGTPTFTQEFLPVADLENFIPGALPDAPQLGSPELIEVNDRRALDAAWNDNALWLTTTYQPFAGPNAGQTTALWFKLDTSAVTGAGAPSGLITVDQFGEIGGEDIAAGAYTFFPSVAINRYGSAAFGFSASAPSIYAGAFVAARGPHDLAGTVRTPETVAPGLAPYKRYFGGPRNRWGDYSGISVDPANDDFFWVYNEFADTPGSPTVGSQGPEDGRWGTSWARGKFVAGPKN